MNDILILAGVIMLLCGWIGWLLERNKSLTQAMEGATMAFIDIAEGRATVTRTEYGVLLKPVGVENHEK